MSELVHGSGLPGLYPERDTTKDAFVERVFRSIGGGYRGLSGNHRSGMQACVRIANTFGRELSGLPDDVIEAHSKDLRADLLRHGLDEQRIPQVFALVRELAWRELGQRPYDEQLMGAWTMMRGMLAEMETGEGKTLTATLPACAAALAGIPVHIVTVNDYLAQRDAERMAPLYTRLGLSVGVILEGLDLPARQHAYACDVTYCSSKQLAFDYLRDRVARGNRSTDLKLRLKDQCGSSGERTLMLRGLPFAIVDEADSVLIDEASTPLILSRDTKNLDQIEAYRQAWSLAQQLKLQKDFRIDQGRNEIRLTEAGRTALAKLASTLSGIWAGRRHRHWLVRRALFAGCLLKRDRDYLIADGKVQIIDSNTGRVMPDRTWEQGLHQLVEIKEGCEVSADRETLAQISFQKFFRRYLKLAGMTGTARQSARELSQTYHLPVVRIPTHRPLRRDNLGICLYPDHHARDAAIVTAIRQQTSVGRPVLVGTRTLGGSESLAETLTRDKLDFAMLNARQDQAEAEVIAEAGQPRRITVATNMAGRGTDIALADAVVEAGGLHVISAECNDSHRIDRQLYGRCARQGDPGSYEVMISLDDDLFARTISGWLIRIFSAFCIKSPLRGWPVRLLVRYAQNVAERRNRQLRRNLMKLDDRMRDFLAFSGGSE